jgi:hypothetical protein
VYGTSPVGLSAINIDLGVVRGLSRGSHLGLKHRDLALQCLDLSVL